jgi:hypothetical protein
MAESALDPLHGSHARRWSALIPMLTASLVLLVGLALAIRAAAPLVS